MSFPFLSGASKIDPNKPFGVVDIGSNSIRLVVFERVSRNPWTRFNEKVICGIGRGLVTTGHLHEEGTERALAALSRFRTLADGMGVDTLRVVATAAVRDASDGEAFAEEAQRRIGAEIRVLTGEDEARLAAKGVIMGIPDADGLVGDLGGGSLDITEITGGALGEAETYPFGPLRLMDASDNKIKTAREIVAEGLAQTEWLKGIKGRKLYLVGGIWRNFSAIVMSQTHHSINVLQNFEVPAKEARTMAGALAGLSRKSLEQIPELPTRRVEAMPFGAVVLQQLIKETGASEIVTSAYGVREGVLYEALTEDQRAADPMLEAASDLNVRNSRSPGHAVELIKWVEGLTADWPRPDQRYVEAACYLSDTGWREHPDYRARQSFDRILTLPVAGLSHKGRAFLALTIYERYGGNSEGGEIKWAARFIDDGELMRARVLGRALRLAYNLSGAVAGLLPLTTLSLTDKQVVLTVNKARGPLSGESVRKRLATLANAMNLEDHVIFGED